MFNLESILTTPAKPTEIKALRGLVWKKLAESAKSITFSPIGDPIELKISANTDGRCIKAPLWKIKAVMCSTLPLFMPFRRLHTRPCLCSEQC